MIPIKMTSDGGTSHSTTMPPTHAAKRQAEAERDKSRPFYVANQIIGNLFTYFNTDYQSFIICSHFLQGTGIHAGAMSRLYSHTA